MCVLNITYLYIGALVYGLPQFIFGTYFPDIPSPGPTGLSPTPGLLPNTSLTPASPASSLQLESCADSIDFSSADCEATGQNWNALVFFLHWELFDGHWSCLTIHNCTIFHRRYCATKIRPCIIMLVSRLCFKLSAWPVRLV